MAIWLQTEASTHASDDGGLHGITECTQLTWNSSTKHTETQSAHMKALQRSIEAVHRGKLVSHNTVRPGGVAFDLSCAKPVQALDDNHGFSQHLVFSWAGTGISAGGRCHPESVNYQTFPHSYSESSVALPFTGRLTSHCCGSAETCLSCGWFTLHHLGP